jgi:two-component system sensor histidine kinase PilS (NtrC family)
MESGLLYIEIIDCGPGMDQKIRQQLFEPFVTTEYQGSGLGLYIAHQLCQMNGATIACLPASTGGCKFQLCFGLSPNKE